MRYLVLILVLLLAGCGGCAQVVPPAPPPPVPPAPPTPPEPPAPVQTVDRATMEAIEVGSPAEGLSWLPAPHDRVTVGEKVIWVWFLDETRPDGSHPSWEVHVVRGTIVLSTDF